MGVDLTISEALERIRGYAFAFSEGIARCQNATAFNAHDWEDAYNRLNRLRDRYIHEKKNLAPPESEALSKVFEKDVFIEGLLNIRQVGEHVQKRSAPVIRLMTNEPITFCVETSAMAFFGGPIVNLPSTTGQLHAIDHLFNLTEAEKRINRALTRGTDKRED